MNVHFLLLCIKQFQHKMNRFNFELNWKCWSQSINQKRYQQNNKWTKDASYSSNENLWSIWIDDINITKCYFLIIHRRYLYQLCKRYIKIKMLCLFLVYLNQNVQILFFTGTKNCKVLFIYCSTFLFAIHVKISKLSLGRSCRKKGLNLPSTVVMVSYRD